MLSASSRLEFGVDTHAATEEWKEQMKKKQEKSIHGEVVYRR